MNKATILLLASLFLPLRETFCLNEIPPAFGRHINLQWVDFAQAKSFDATNRIVGTYYFYWYDAPSKMHVVDDDGTDALTTHPPTLEGLSWKSAAWHRKQLEDMIAAGIDVVLPVFWGAPSEQDTNSPLHWSYEGIPPLIKAREELAREGKEPPRIGMFYDTSTLQYNSWSEHQDLTTDRGRRWFYATIRDFFSMVPPKHWAMINEKPIILLYSAAFAKAHDQSVVEYLKAQFPKDFGSRTPWLAREVSWRVKSDSVVEWGAALGWKYRGGIAAVGPGYDHSAVPGRDRLVAERRNGAFYEENWLKALRQPVHFIMVETWNEWHEGTDIAESREHGRQYIDLTRKFATMFKQGITPPRPKGPFTGVRSASVSLAAKNIESGLQQRENVDGATTSTNIAGVECRVIVPAPGHGHFIYFAADDSFKHDRAANYTLEVEYYDLAPGEFTVEFDGGNPEAPFGGAYTLTEERVALTGQKEWRSATFTLNAARLNNSQNRKADFRLSISSPRFAIRKATLTR